MADTIIYYKKKGTDYETETSDYYRCDYCHCFIIVLAFYSRRLECLAQCKLIFSIIMRGCSDK